MGFLAVVSRREIKRYVALVDMVPLWPWQRWVYGWTQ